MNSDTIAAIATPAGQGAISIVRLSGPASRAIVRKIFRSRRDEAFRRTHRLYYGHIIDPENGQIMDEVLASFMQAPQTYTREDMAEINTHGGILASRTILSLVLGLGARLAEPGEFTKRAFLNGRIDLSQAEAVISLIQAKTEQGLKAAAGQVSGKIKKEVEEVKEELFRLLAPIEAAIDFPEDVGPATDPARFKAALAGITGRIGALLERSKWGVVVRQGAKVVIAGPANAGKSTLLNQLAEKERAIVTDIPGTTRDALEEQVQIKGMLFTFVDTAGLAESTERLEQEARKKTLEYLAQADLVVVVIDGSRALAPDLDTICRQAKDKPGIIAINKTDLPQKLDEKALKAVLAGKEMVHISALNGNGVEELKTIVYQHVSREYGLGAGEAVFADLGQQQALKQAVTTLEELGGALGQDTTEECWAEHLRQALNQIGEFTGETVSEEVLRRVFSQFCIGK